MTFRNSVAYSAPMSTTTQCPKCGKQVTDRHFACVLASIAGKTGGKAKARTSDQARSAAMVRWSKAARKVSPTGRVAGGQERRDAGLSEAVTAPLGDKPRKGAYRHAEKGSR